MEQQQQHPKAVALMKQRMIEKINAMGDMEVRSQSLAGGRNCFLGDVELIMLHSIYRLEDSLIDADIDERDQIQQALNGSWKNYFILYPHRLVNTLSILK